MGPSRALRCDPVRLFIFDADGTLRRTLVPGQPCPHAPDEWELIPGVRETLQRFDWRSSGLRVGIASNQDHVGYGLLDERTARKLLADMVSTAFGGVRPAPRIEICPHTPEQRCCCWKPWPTMLLRIMRHFETPPERTLFVGDSPSDRRTALAAGVRFMWRGDFFAN